MYINKVTTEVYKKILDYKLEKCNYASLTVYTDQHLDEHLDIINIITSNPKYSKQYILSNYSEILLGQIYNDFKNDKRIYNVKEHVRKIKKSSFRKCESNDELENFLYQHESENRKSSIFSAIQSFVYNNFTTQFIEEYRSKIVKIKDELYEHELTPFHKKEAFYKKEYIFQLDDELKQIIHNTYLYDWSFPMKLEDLSLFVENYLWIYSVTHEELCYIYCETEEEYNYLKSMGVEFYEEHFIPQEKQEIVF
ncbi:MAG: hypothetical protein E7169_01760 [Firmicutes bacterium]|nr:hypothetical protein [Bacillota bacterium]